MEKNNTQIDLLSDDVTIMTSSLRKVVCMFRIKFPTKRIFRIFRILRTDGMAPFGTYLWNDPRSNFGPILHRLRDMTGFMCYLPHPYSTLILGVFPLHQIADVGRQPAHGP